MEEKVVNQEKRNKFIEYAGKRVNNVLHDIQILEPMARSNSYDFTREDIEEMFDAMQETLNEAKAEFNKKFEERARATKKVFTFGNRIEQKNGAQMEESVVEVLTENMEEIPQVHEEINEYNNF